MNGSLVDFRKEEKRIKRKEISSRNETRFFFIIKIDFWVLNLEFLMECLEFLITD